MASGVDAPVRSIQGLLASITGGGDGQVDHFLSHTFQTASAHLGAGRDDGGGGGGGVGGGGFGGVFGHSWAKKVGVDQLVALAQVSRHNILQNRRPTPPHCTTALLNYHHPPLVPAHPIKFRGSLWSV